MSKRVILLGCAGSGKTYFSCQFGVRTSAPVICLDAIWESNAEKSCFRAKMIELHAGNVWISDGNFADLTFDVRLPRATLILWLERPRLLCTWRAVARVFRRGQAHKMTQLAKVLTFIWRFDRDNRPKIERNRLLYGSQLPVVRLRNDAEIEAFLGAAAGDSPSAALH